MKKLTTLSVSMALIAGAAAAQEVDPDIDVNGDGFYSYPEVGSMYPEISDMDFSGMDTTGDGLLDMAEVATAQEAGMLPATE